MRKFTKTILTGSAVLGMAMSANVAHAATATADAKAKIIDDVQIQNLNASALDFGLIVADADGGSVTVNAAGNRTSCTGLVCAGTVDAADFRITGEDSAAVTVTVDSSVQLANQASGSTATMTATLQSTVPTALSTTGTADFSVGGVLAVGNNQANGVYEGTFNVTAVYN